MLSHADIWGAIDKLALTAGISVSALARRSGLDPTTFNKSKRQTRDGKPRWPSTESIAKVLEATGCSVAEFAALVVGGTTAPPAFQRIPVVGYAQACDTGAFDESGYPLGGGWDEIIFPDLGDARVFALEIAGDSLAPFYRNGDFVILSPGASLRRGDRVFLRTRGGELMAKELARRTARRVDLLGLDRAHPPLSVPAEEVAWMSRIVWASQ